MADSGAKAGGGTVADSGTIADGGTVADGGTIADGGTVAPAPGRWHRRGQRDGRRVVAPVLPPGA
jgi:hypothetical protein